MFLKSVGEKKRTVTLRRILKNVKSTPTVLRYHVYGKQVMSEYASTDSSAVRSLLSK